MTTAEVERVEQQGMVLVSQAEEIAVRDASTFQQAGFFLRTIAGYIRKVGEVLDPIVEAAHRSHKVAVEQRKKLLEPAQTAERIVKREMVAFEQVERDRVAREQRAAEAERRRMEDEARLAIAASLEQQGKTAAAEAALTAPVMVPVFTPPVQHMERAEGISFRDNWKASVTDLMALVQAVAAGTAPLACLDANMVTLNGLARSLKDQMRVPGVEARNERISSVKA